jgi:hypothetical protein
MKVVIGDKVLELYKVELPTNIALSKTEKESGPEYKVLTIEPGEYLLLDPEYGSAIIGKRDYFKDALGLGERVLDAVDV